MKNKLYYMLLAGTLAFGSPYALRAQTDVTDTYLKNPNFENQFTDWDMAEMQAQTNTSFTLKDGNTYVEKWTGVGGYVGNASVSQTISPLPNGVYQLTAAAQNIQENSSATQSGACIFAGEAQAEVSARDTYTLTFTVIEGQTTLGFRAEGATGNWIACDNFRLYAVSNELADVQEELQRRIDAARELVSEKMQKDVATELNAAIEAAQQETSAATDENVATVAARMKEAVAAAETSIQSYKDLQAVIDEALAVDADESLTGAADFNEAIKTAQAAADNLEATTEELAAAGEALQDAMLLFSISNPTDEAPEVVTDTRYARGSTLAFGRSTITGVAIGQLKEHGFCWSTDPEPTILDNRTTEFINNNGYIYVMRNLEPSTIYYVRAYAMTQGNAVGYGDPIKIITIPKGQITWTYNNGGPADANARINAAVGSAVDYWNNLTSIKGLNLTVNYGSGTPTADCSYGGWMRVGTNASYQRTGTIMHEMGHAIGVGQHGIWWSSDFRKDGDRGDWLGERANAVLKFWDNNPDAVMTGDNTHMWPYGINGAHEDNGTEALYFANGLITQGLGEDGLPPSGGGATPAYVFEQDDRVKYYIKSESETGGLYDSYLVANQTTTIKCEEMTAAEALANDTAAWYITFDPKTCYYQFQNVGTGKFLTYNSSRNKFLSTQKELPSTTEDFHLMRGRVDVVIGNGTNGITTRGYWIMRPENNTNPHCMTVSLGGRTSTDTYNPKDSEVTQRWIFLNASEVQAFDDAVVADRKAELDDMLAQIKALAETPHTEDTPGTDAAFSERIAAIEASMAEEGLTYDKLENLTAEALDAGMDFLAEATPESKEQPFDLTFMMEDAGISDGEGWSTKPAISFSAGEFFQRTFDMYQTVDGLPAGTYQFCGQGFQRPGVAADVYNAFVNGTNNVNAVIYAGEKEETLSHIAAEAQSHKLGGNESSVGSNPTMYIPNDMQAASIYFNTGLYDNSVVTELKEDGDNLKVGVKSDDMGSSYWCIFDNFRLYYYGSMTEDEVTGIQSTLADKTDGEGLFSTPADVYSLQGVLVRHQATSTDGLPKGIYIVKGKKILVR